MRTHRVLMLALLLVWPVPLHAQQALDLRRQGVDAYRRLEYDSAVALLRGALDARDGLDAASRAEAWVYVGAAELFRGRTHAATTAFHEAIHADVRHRADPLVFPPDVTQAFDAVRLATRFVEIRLPADTVLLPDSFRYPIVLYASSAHAIEVRLNFTGGRLARRLYAGPVSDSLAIAWDGMDGRGARARSGQLEVVVVSGDSPEQRTTRRTATLVEPPVDTIAHPSMPADSLARRSDDGQRHGIAALLTGVLAGTAVAMLPAAVARDGRGSERRYAVAAALGAGGIVGFFAHRPGPHPAQIAMDRETREAWRSRLESVRRENEQRRAKSGVRITSPVQVSTGRDSP